MQKFIVNASFSVVWLICSVIWWVSSMEYIGGVDYLYKFFSSGAVILGVCSVVALVRAIYFFKNWKERGNYPSNY